MLRKSFTSQPERERRVGALRAAMQQESLDALVICGRDDVRYRGRTFYITDYWQLLADSHVILTKDSGPAIVGNLVWGLGQAYQTDWASAISMSGQPGYDIGKYLQDHRLADARIGIVGLSDASMAYQHVLELQESIPAATLCDATALFERVRQECSDEELSNFREVSANRIAIFDRLSEFVEPGVFERTVAAQAHRICREHGLRDPMVLVWSTPYIGAQAFGEMRPINAGSVVTVWIESADENGYWLEYRECYSLGPISAEYRDYWAAYKTALQSGLDKLRPGNMASEFAFAVKAAFDTDDYQVNFPDPGYQHEQYSLHGIGSDAIQGVWTPGNDRELAVNEMVNVHPVIKFESDDLVRKFDSFGVTDNVLITPEGGKFMTHDDQITRGFRELA